MGGFQWVYAFCWIDLAMQRKVFAAVMAATMQAAAAARKTSLFISNAEDDDAAAAAKKSINLSLSETAAIANASAIRFYVMLPAQLDSPNNCLIAWFAHSFDV